MDPVEAGELVDRRRVIVDSQVDDGVGERLRSRRRARRRGRRPTAGLAGRHPQPAPLRGSRAAARRVAFLRSRRTWPRARRRSLPRRGCFPALRSTGRRPAGPVQALGAGVGSAVAVAVDDPELAVLAPFVVRGQALDDLFAPSPSREESQPVRAVPRVGIGLGRDRSHPAAPPRARSIRRRGTSTASRRPTARRRGRTRRSSTGDDGQRARSCRPARGGGCRRPAPALRARPAYRSAGGRCPSGTGRSPGSEQIQRDRGLASGPS